MNVEATITKMELNGNYDNDVTDITFEYEIEEGMDLEQTIFTWSNKLASKFKVGQKVSIMLGVSEIVG